MSDSYDTHSPAITLFLDNTQLRKSDRRDALVDQIKKSPRPMSLARDLLEKFGAKTVTARNFEIWLLQLIAKRGPFDPVFDERIAAARSKASNGKLYKSDLPPLEKALKDSWCPYSVEDKANAKNDATDRLIALGIITYTKPDGKDSE